MFKKKLLLGTLIIVSASNILLAPHAGDDCEGWCMAPLYTMIALIGVGIILNDQGPENGICPNSYFNSTPEPQPTDRSKALFNQDQAIPSYPLHVICSVQNKTSEVLSYGACPKATGKLAVRQLANFQQLKKNNFDSLSPAEKRKKARFKRNNFN